MTDRDTYLNTYDYNEATGELTWKRPYSGKTKGKVGDIAGTYSKANNRWYVWNLNGKQVPRARVIWTMKTGVDPVGSSIIHKNGDSSDDRWDNLEQLMHISDKPKRYLGVQKWRNSNIWFARVKVNDKWKRIGTYSTDIEAAKAYNDEAIKLYGDEAKLNTFDMADS
jgi:hypothetical protein